MRIHTKSIILTLILTCWLRIDLAAEPEPRPSARDDAPAIIVIDAGHGGTDTGVKGPKGSLEKTLMLELTQKIKARLVPDYDVRLTRDDDYQVAFTERTAMANTSRAALMISLHAGASFTPRAATVTIYLHQAPLREQPLETEAADALLSEWQWQHQQARHHGESQRFGDLLARHLGSMPSAPPVFIQTAHLPVLAGADLPAVLVEFEDLSSAAGEERLSETEWQQKCAGAIASAVRKFLLPPKK
jgi:N-acetylmuramoyl-L-alanine amidase